MRTLPVTNHLLHTAYRAKQDEDLTPLRVQKLLYFLHGWYSAITSTALLTEPFIRGKYGPKLASLDVDLAPYKGVPVGDYISEWNPKREKLEPFFVDMQSLPQFTEVLERSGRNTRNTRPSSSRPCPTAPAHRGLARRRTARRFHKRGLPRSSHARPPSTASERQKQCLDSKAGRAGVGHQKKKAPHP